MQEIGIEWDSENRRYFDGIVTKIKLKYHYCVTELNTSRKMEHRGQEKGECSIIIKNKKKCNE